jgi:hypothetical protein
MRCGISSPTSLQKKKKLQPNFFSRYQEKQKSEKENKRKKKETMC